MTRRQMLLVVATWPLASLVLGDEPPKPKANPGAARDSEVLEVVLKDLLTWSDSPLEPRKAKEKQIRFSPEALTVKLELGDVFERPFPEQWKKLTPAQLGRAREAAVDLVHRVGEKDALKGVKLKDPRIIIWDKAREAAEPKRRGAYDHPQVFEVHAPGYSQGQEIAIVRVRFPWSIHGGFGTYVLLKKEGEWIVLVRDFIYFA